MKTTVYVMMALLTLSLVAASPFQAGWARQLEQHQNLKYLDDYCPAVETHPGYSVQQIMVRTSKGIVCQFPSDPLYGKKKVVSVPVIVPPLPDPEPVCEAEEICEEVCDWDFGWYRSGRHWKYGWHEDCEDVCEFELVCEQESEDFV